MGGTGFRRLLRIKERIRASGHSMAQKTMKKSAAATRRSHTTVCGRRSRRRSYLTHHAYLSVGQEEGTASISHHKRSHRPTTFELTTLGSGGARGGVLGRSSRGVASFAFGAGAAGFGGRSARRRWCICTWRYQYCGCSARTCNASTPAMVRPGQCATTPGDLSSRFGGFTTAGLGFFFLASCFAFRTFSTRFGNTGAKTPNLEICVLEVSELADSSIYLARSLPPPSGFTCRQFTPTHTNRAR
jgi:hypothetical protein